MNDVDDLKAEKREGEKEKKFGGIFEKKQLYSSSFSHSFVLQTFFVPTKQSVIRRFYTMVDDETKQ